MKIIGLVLAVCFAAPALAQPPEGVRKIVGDLAGEFGMTPLGDPFLSELEDEGEETLDVRVAPDKLTYIHLEGNDDTLELKVRVLAGTKVFLPEFGSTVQMPAGNGDTVKVEVAMSCEFITCEYFVQTFVR